LKAIILIYKFDNLQFDNLFLVHRDTESETTEFVQQHVQ